MGESHEHYNVWYHTKTHVSYCFCIFVLERNFCYFRNLSRLLSLLSNVLVKTGYRRARDEVMWIMLQIAGTFQPHLQKEQVEEMARLYNVSKTFSAVSLIYVDIRLKFETQLSFNCFF